uniref:alpha-mannosidase n=1 Tax=Phallusia mammillata TaxID=59560 RepID=A0A6F9DKV0_9ASCI|nr:alpha-mannosidase 2C1 [Phallusia mammillata]
MEVTKNPFVYVTTKHRRSTLERIEKFISQHYFTDVNLYGRIYKSKKTVDAILHYGPTDRNAHPAVFKQTDSFTPAKTGQSFGTTFSTHWFILDLHLNEQCLGEKICLIWDSGCEALLWKDQKPVFSFSSMNDNGLHKTYTVTENLQSEEMTKQRYFVEMACNRELGEGKDGMIKPPDMKKSFTLQKVELAVVNKEAYEVYVDLSVLYDITKSLADDCQRGLDALYTGNEIINLLVSANFSADAYQAAHIRAKQFFSQTNAPSQHVVHAIGHCHIDSAWLWPYAETVRKCARSWISTLCLMKKYPDFKFACSQAQQFDWVKQNYPQIFVEMKEFAQKNQFLPVGGTWVEMDGNLPSGESMVQQFFYGQKFFRKEFGMTCSEFWLPDTFGYSANLPQIMKEAEIKRFVTQKISWSLVNKFPHHTFYWEGIDGTKQLSHFPPGESYGMSGTAKELLHTMNNHADKGRSDTSMFLFGYGDGGGGPTEPMLERLSRMADCASLPRVKLSSPTDFFTEVEQNAKQLCTWVGELFLELHNGTYTSLANIKKQNRKCECLLHDVEIVSTMALGKPEFIYPSSTLERIWKLLLLNQFHDVLPGTSIEMVNKDALEYYTDVRNTGQEMLQKAIDAILQTNSNQKSFAINTLSWPRKEIVEIENKLVAVSTPSVGYAQINDKVEVINYVKIAIQENGDIELGNGLLQCTIDKFGRISSLKIYDKNQSVSDECVAEGCYANQFVMFDDVPLYWDAWDVMDYHLETRTPIIKVTDAPHIVQSNQLRAACKFTVAISDISSLTQVISLDADSPVLKFCTKVDWHESHKFLKVEFPWNIRSPKGTYEIQFGHIERPTHQNTSWESAKYEVWAHKWCDMSQHNLGVAILNDCKYGCSAFSNVMRLSLLRSPKAPDGNADMGEHSFTYAIMPHKGTFQDAGVIQQAYQLNYPLHVIKELASNDGDLSFVKISSKAVVMEALRKSEFHSDSLVIRLYEAYGGSANDVLIQFPCIKLKKVQRCNVLEDVKEQVAIGDEKQSFSTSFKPFQIKSFIVSYVNV